MIQRRLIVHGRVQGVWFRDTVRQAALLHGVAGWARNVPDGSVEIVLEGTTAAVDAVVELCRTGPPGARVDRVDIEPSALAGLTGFDVR